MFSLFKSPKVNIRDHIPQHALLAFVAVETAASIQLDDLHPNKREAVLAYIVSVWACNSAMAGAFQLSQRDYRYIQNTGLNCAGLLSEDIQDRAARILDELIGKGLIPTG